MITGAPDALLLGVRAVLLGSGWRPLDRAVVTLHPPAPFSPYGSDLQDKQPIVHPVVSARRSA